MDFVGGLLQDATEGKGTVRGRVCALGITFGISEVDGDIGSVLTVTFDRWEIRKSSPKLLYK